jgi:hypothetical protein
MDEQSVISVPGANALTLRIEGGSTLNTHTVSPHPPP